MGYKTALLAFLTIGMLAAALPAPSLAGEEVVIDGVPHVRNSAPAAAAPEPTTTTTAPPPMTSHSEATIFLLEIEIKIRQGLVTLTAISDRVGMSICLARASR